MATGRIGVTPTLRTRWSKAPAGGTTSLSGLDDNSVSLVYDVGYEAVYRNGVLLSRTNDYTATTGNSITLIDATIAGDIIEVFANQLLPLTNAIGNGQYTAKGALLSATAASTPAVLTVGSNNQVLTADSTTSTGLKWATPSASTTSYTLLNSGGTALSGTSTTVSSLSGYNKIFAWVDGYSISSNGNMRFRLNSDTGSNYYAASGDGDTNAMTWITVIGGAVPYTADIFINVDGANSTSIKPVAGTAVKNDGSTAYFGGYYNGSSVISSITIIAGAGSFNGGTVYVYGAN